MAYDGLGVETNPALCQVSGGSKVYAMQTTELSVLRVDKGDSTILI